MIILNIWENRKWQPNHQPGDCPDHGALNIWVVQPSESQHGKSPSLGCDDAKKFRHLSRGIINDCHDDTGWSGEWWSSGGLHCFQTSTLSWDRRDHHGILAGKFWIRCPKSLGQTWRQPVDPAKKMCSVWIIVSCSAWKKKNSVSATAACYCSQLQFVSTCNSGELGNMYSNVLSTYIYIDIYIYIHTYIHTYILSSLLLWGIIVPFEIPIYVHIVPYKSCMCVCVSIYIHIYIYIIK